MRNGSEKQCCNGSSEWGEERLLFFFLPVAKKKVHDKLLQSCMNPCKEVVG